MIREDVAKAEATLRESEMEIRAGNIEGAETQLSTLLKFRDKFPTQFDNAMHELKSARAAKSALRLWADGRTSDAIRALADIRDSLDDPATAAADTAAQPRTESFAHRKAVELQKEIVDSQVATALKISPLTAADFAARAYLLHNARDADPTSLQVAGMISANYEGLVERLAATLPGLNPTGTSSEARLRLALRMSASDRLQEKVEQPPALVSAAYPHLRVSLLINDPRGCLPSSAHATLEAGLRKELSPVAEISQADWDLQFSLDDVSCPKTDIPKLSVEPVNSTYVAGHNQLVNPSYTQLENHLLLNCVN
jgi:hypothetical protein